MLECLEKQNEIITLKNLSVRYKNFYALKDINISIKDIVEMILKYLK